RLGQSVLPRLDPLVCQVTHRLELLAMLPSHAKLRASNCASPSNGSSGTLHPTLAMTLPSLGATLCLWRAALGRPPPGMFCAMTLGLPGMYLPINRPSSRA